MYSEALNTGCKTCHNRSCMGYCPVWMVENLYFRTKISNSTPEQYIINEDRGFSVAGYWLLSSFPGQISGRRLYFNGYIHNSDSIVEEVTNHREVRSVITVHIENLSK